jgi:hypothetical protein
LHEAIQAVLFAQGFGGSLLKKKLKAEAFVLCHSLILTYVCSYQLAFLLFDDYHEYLYHNLRYK